MSLISLQFLLFIVGGCILYYILPKKIQWIVLLLLSYCFYLAGGKSAIAYMLVTTFSVWAAGLFIEKVNCDVQVKLKQYEGSSNKEEKKALKYKAKKKCQMIFWSTLLINFGILGYLKYSNFLIGNVNQLLAIAGKKTEIYPLSDLILPLGISFYTFQAIGYLIEIYWGRIHAEQNIFRFALFVSFFPQVVQGPISKYQELSGQLYVEHKFDLQKVEKAVLLILWGYFKKLVISNRTILIVNEVFNFPENYGSVLTIFGVLMYSIQQYADFSGGIDIIAGVAELFGVELPPNFRRPYFAVSLADFWRRWHISLGSWMRDYVFYPLAMTKWMNNIRKIIKRKVSDTLAKACPGAICNIIVFLIVGVWHGAYWHCIAWGLYNGLILAFSTLLEPVYTKMRMRLHINLQSWWYKGVCILRTFIIVNIGWFFDRTGVSDAIIMIKNVLFDFRVSEIAISSLWKFGLILKDYIYLFFAIGLLFAVSVYQEKTNESVREYIMKKPLILRWIILYVFLFFLVAGTVIISGVTGEFMYAQF